MGFLQMRMKWGIPMDNIYDILRRYEFNKTEPETLQELVKKAIDKGTVAQQEVRNLARAANLFVLIRLAKSVSIANSSAFCCNLAG